MIEVGNMVQSKYRLSNGKEGNLGVVLRFHDAVPTLMQVF